MVATYLGQALGWYRPGEAARFIGAVVGAIVVLLIWGAVVGRTPIASKPFWVRLFCIGVQILWSGGSELIRSVLQP